MHTLPLYILHNLSHEEITRVIDWVNRDSNKALAEFPDLFRDAIKRSMLPICQQLKRHPEASKNHVPEMAIESLNDLCSQGKGSPAHEEAIRRLQNPQTDRDREDARSFYETESLIKWVYPYCGDALFNHVSEVPEFYREQLDETVDHEIDLITGRDEYDPHKDMERIYDLLAVKKGDKCVNRCCEDVKVFYGVRGVMNAMFRAEADKLETAFDESITRYVNEISKDLSSRDTSTKLFSIER